jgi:hypothetical protein
MKMATAVRIDKKSPFRSLALGLLAGAAVGVAITALVARRGHAPKTAVVATVDDESPPAKRRFDRADWAAPQFTPPARAPEPALDPAAEERKVNDLHASQLDAHRREPIDGHWAAPAARAFAADLGIIEAHRRVKVTAVNCRSHSCSAELEWPSRDAATGEWADLLHYPYRYGCARMIVIPPAVEGQPAGLTKTTMLFECSDKKNDPIPTESPIAPPEEFAQNAGSHQPPPP